MSKNIIALLFTFIIITVITIPTVMTLAESSCDVSVFFDTGEEEENKGKESLKDIEIKVFHNQFNDLSFVNQDDLRPLEIYSNTYDSIYSLILSPPPEQNIS